MVGERDENLRPSILIALNQLFRFPVEQRPLRTKVLISKCGRRTVMFQLKLIFFAILDIHVPRIPVACFRNALRTPVRPDAELRIAIPFRRLILQQGIPCRLVGTFAAQSGDRRLHWDAVPRTPRYRQLRRLAPGSRFPVLVVELYLYKLAVLYGIKNSLVCRRGAKLSVISRNRAK